MYTVNPFRKKGKKASDLTSTHPPISERIRILRSMAGASMMDYDRSYSQIKGKNVIPTSTLAAAAGAVPLRVTAVGGQGVERTRETSDVMLRLHNYKTFDCKCGTKLRIPPKFKGSTVKCPHCGTIHSL